MVRCGICVLCTLRMCFMHTEYHWFPVYQMRIWFAGSTVETVVVILWLEFVFVFSLVEANSFVLVSGYFDIWNLFSLDAAFWCSWKLFFTGATYGCSFCRVVERFAPTTSDVVGEEPFDRLCVYVWCHSKGWRNLVVPEGFPFCVFWDLSVLILSPGWWKCQQSHFKVRDRFSIRWLVERVGVWRGRDI